MKIQISLHNHAVLSYSSLGAIWISTCKGANVILADNENSDQTVRMRGLISRLLAHISESAFSHFGAHVHVFDEYANSVFTLSIRTHQLLTIYVLKFEPVQFTTRCCV